VPAEQDQLRHARQAGADPGLRSACHGEGVKIAFQPIFRLVDGAIYGYEALMRPPRPWTDPLALIEAAHGAGLGVTLELACCDIAIREFVRRQLDGRLFLNVGAASMHASGATRHHIIGHALAQGLAPNRIVVELTEREPIPDIEEVVRTMRALRDCGLGVALDDYGQGYSGLRLWLEMRPDIVKIDQYFVSGLQASSAKFEALRSIARLAESLETQLVAEGIETPAELTVLRDLGIAFGQGFVLGRPSLEPPLAISEEARAALGRRQIAVFPEKRLVHAPHQTVGQLLIPVAAVGRNLTNREVARLFEDAPQTHAIAVVDGGVPIGLINRQRFLDRLHKPFHMEIYGKQSCTVFMNARPLVVEAGTPVESLMPVLSSDDQRYLSDGFIIVSNGSYMGLGTGEALVRSVSSLRIEAARHANPLTFLPGNIPVTEHIARLLASGARFVAAYADMDNFKPYNDQYGYWRGDEMIKLAASALQEHVNPLVDFIGHVGGDDFILLLQSADWQARCEAMLRRFTEGARGLYIDEDVARGGLQAEDRLGNPAFFPLTTLSIGLVEVEPGVFASAEAVATRAAIAKRQAKRSGGNRLWKSA
jgi:diguanylate cyclase (GGDEF)-like protein